MVLVDTDAPDGAGVPDPWGVYYPNLCGTGYGTYSHLVGHDLPMSEDLRIARVWEMHSTDEKHSCLYTQRSRRR